MLLALCKMPELGRRINTSDAVEECSSLPPLKYIAILLVSAAPLRQGTNSTHCQDMSQACLWVFSHLL